MAKARKAKATTTPASASALPPGATLIRPWTAEELRIPLWWRSHNFPPSLASAVDEVLPLSEGCELEGLCFAITHFAAQAPWTVLRERTTPTPGAHHVEVLVSNISMTMRFMREAILALDSRPQVSTRLDRLMDATKAAVDEFQNGRVYCDKVGCSKRHYVDGPWKAACARLNDAVTDVMMLAGSTADTPDVWIDSGTAANRSDLSTEAIRKASQRAGWQTKKEGRRLCYRLADLKAQWPTRNFEIDPPSKK